MGVCQQPHIRDGALEQQIQEELEKIVLPARLTEWLFSMIKKEHETLEAMRLQSIRNHSEEYERANRKLMNLVDMRASGLVEEFIFAQKRREYMIERQAAEERLKDAGEGVTDWVENARRVLNFAERAKETFEVAKQEGDTMTMRSILSALGSNLSLRDKKLIVTKGKLLSALEEAASRREQQITG